MLWEGTKQHFDIVFDITFDTLLYIRVDITLDLTVELIPRLAKSIGSHKQVRTFIYLVVFDVRTKNLPRIERPHEILDFPLCKHHALEECVVVGPHQCLVVFLDGSRHSPELTVQVEDDSIDEFFFASCNDIRESSIDITKQQP